MKRKKIFALLLASLMMLSLASCGKDEENTLVAGTKTSSAAGNGGKASSADYESYPEMPDLMDDINSGLTNHDDAYYETLRDIWKSEPEQGYVWTITINDMERIQGANLVAVETYVGLSMSHVGVDPYGVYRGAMGVSNWIDISGVNTLLALIPYTAGGFEMSDDTLWVRDDDFVMAFYPCDEEFTASVEKAYDESDHSEQNYKKYAEVEDQNIYYDWTDNKKEEEKPLTDTEQQLMDQYVNSKITQKNSEIKDFEKPENLSAIGCDWKFNKTSGSDGLIVDTDIFVVTPLGGTHMIGRSSVYGNHVENMRSSQSAYDTGGGPMGLLMDLIDGEARHVETETEFVDEEYDLPAAAPYYIKIYDTGDVVMETHATNGINMRFFGTIDKIPVEDTIVVKPEYLEETPEVVTEAVKKGEEKRAESETLGGQVDAQLDETSEEDEVHATAEQDALALKTWQEEYPEFPVWNAGGYDYEVYIGSGDDEYLEFSCRFDTEEEAMEALKAYREYAHSQGFNGAYLEEYSDKWDQNLSKTVNGREMFIVTENAFDGGGENVFLYLERR